jgi:phage tail protein X
MDFIYRTIEGETIDAICWKYYGKTEGVVELVLEANQGLADYGVILPDGVEILLPEDKTEDSSEGFSLWD